MITAPKLTGQKQTESLRTLEDNWINSNLLKTDCKGPQLQKMRKNSWKPAKTRSNPKPLKPIQNPFITHRNLPKIVPKQSQLQNWTKNQWKSLKTECGTLTSWTRDIFPKIGRKNLRKTSENSWKPAKTSQNHPESFNTLRNLPKTDSKHP